MKENLILNASVFLREIPLDNEKKKIDFKSHKDDLSIVGSGIRLYKADEKYYEENDNKYKDLVGEIYGLLIDIDYTIDNKINIKQIMHDENADLSSLATILFDGNNIKEEFITLNNNIYYLDRLEIKEKYRGKGYAKFMLENLTNTLSYVAKINYGLIVVYAQPFDKNEKESVMNHDKDRKERLIKLYEKAGFTRIRNTDYLYKINE